MSDRYKVIEESDSGHCCFEATVIDTHTNDCMNRGYSWVCECFEKEDADRIAAALNQQEAQSND